MKLDDFEKGFGADSSRRQFLQGSMASLVGVSLLGKFGWKNKASRIAGTEPAARQGEPIYKIGAGSIDVTPDKPMRMAGYGTRNKPGLGTAYHALNNKVLTIDDGKKKLIYVHVDHVTTQSVRDKSGMVTIIRDAMKRRGIPPEQIALISDHIHNGPSPNAEYIKMLCDKTIALIDKCLAEAREGRLYFGRGYCAMAVNRRSCDMSGNYLWSYINRYGNHDHEVVLLKAVDLEGKPIAVAFNYGCHPITMGGYQYGNDWVGFAIDEIQKSVPGATVMFLQGCAGDQRPDCPDPEYSLSFQSSVSEKTDTPDPERPARMGRWIAESVVERLRKPMEQIGGPIRSSMTPIQLPVLVGLKPQTKKPDWKIGSNFTTGDWTNEYAEKPWPAYMQPKQYRWLRLAELIRNSVNPDGTFKDTQAAELFVCRIGDQFVHVGMSGEPCAGVGLRIKDQLRGQKVMVTGYTNLSIGYFLAAGQIIEGGYEAFGSGHKVPYSPAAEDVYINEAMEQVEKLATA